jgi:hypothetical protein
MRYEDFIVELVPTADGDVTIRARCVLAGEARRRLALPAAPTELAARFARSHSGDGSDPAAGGARNLSVRPAGRERAADFEDPAALGAALFNAVFAGEVRSLYDRALGSLDREDSAGLRVQLRLDLKELPSLSAVPWELLYREDTGNFLALSRRSPVVRYLELPLPAPPRPVPEIFRILAVVPQLTDLAPLDLEAERRNLEALERSVERLEVEILEPADLNRLRGALVDREFHALHFMGHGDFDPRTGEGTIILDGPAGGSRAVAARDLAPGLQDLRSLRLAVLNACHTARSGAEEGVSPFAGLAPALMRAGLPAVLAMQLPISDRGAIAFSESFYRRILAGDPVDAAVTEGRQAIRGADPRSPEWAVPALFLRVPDGRIFQSREGRSGPMSRRTSPGVALLLAGNFEDAAAELRKELAAHPTDALPRVALGIALARGRSLCQLPYRTALEIHRLFAAALSDPELGDLAGAALLALETEYFQRNSVREPGPSPDELRERLSNAKLAEPEARLLSCLTVEGTTRDLFLQMGATERNES